MLIVSAGAALKCIIDFIIFSTTNLKLGFAITVKSCVHFSPFYLVLFFNNLVCNESLHKLFLFSQ